MDDLSAAAYAVLDEALEAGGELTFDTSAVGRDEARFDAIHELRNAGLIEHHGGGRFVLVTPPEVAITVAGPGAPAPHGPTRRTRAKGPTVTTDTAAPPTTNLRELPLEHIHPAADNLRADVGDVSGLAQSIASEGLLQALVVTPYVEKNGWKIVAGHRRHAAVRELGWETVRCEIRSMDEPRRSKAMLIENLQREGLSPIEEARGYQRCTTEFGLSQRDLAAQVGVTQGQISKRLKLLTLPKTIVEEVDAGSITVEDALQLAKLVGHGGTKAMARARREANPPYRTLAAAVQRQLEDWNTSKRVDARVAELTQAGAKVVDEDDVGWLPHNAAEGDNVGAVKLEGLHHRREIPDDHDQLPCHAVTVSAYKLRMDHDDPVVPVCTDPWSHPAVDPDADDELAARRTAAEEAAAEAEDAMRRRRETISEILTAFGAGEIRLSQIIPHLLLQLLPSLQLYGPDVTAVHELLGLPAPEAAHGSMYVDDRELIAYAASGGSKLTRTALAMVLVAHDYAGHPSWLSHDRGVARAHGAAARLHLTFLEGHGYEPSKLELDALAAADGESDAA